MAVSTKKIIVRFREATDTLPARHFVHLTGTAEMEFWDNNPNLSMEDNQCKGAMTLAKRLGLSGNLSDWGRGVINKNGDSIFITVMI